MDRKRQVGVVKFYSPRKRYGFISRPDGTDVFFHLSRFRSLSPPVPGHAVQFFEGRNSEGPTAEDIIIVPDSYVQYEVGLLDQLTLEGGIIIRENGQGQVNFLFKDFIPYSQVSHLTEGDEVEMCFLVDDEDGLRATVVRPLDYDPQTAVYPKRREGDEEGDNRRLLGVLYKTESDCEVLEAGRILCQRNLRATLSALAGRIFDSTLQLETRVALTQLMPQIYLDDESQGFLRACAGSLAQLVQEQPQPQESTMRYALEHLVAGSGFPVRWSQYLLPYGLTVLKHLAAYDSFSTLITDSFLESKLSQWLERSVQHVQQRRSGFYYVLTTALVAFDALWALPGLRPSIGPLTKHLIQAAEGRELAQQAYFLRDRLSLRYARALLPYLAQHPEREDLLSDPGVAEMILDWLRQIRREAEARGEPLRETFLDLLVTIEHLAQVEYLRGPLDQFMHPFWEMMDGEELTRLLCEEQLPDEALWPCLRHFEEQEKLSLLLDQLSLRQQLMAWLRRVCQPSQASFSRAEMNTVLKLIDRLRFYEDLRPQLKEVLEIIFADVRRRLRTADPSSLPGLLDQLQDAALPGLAGVLAERLVDPHLSEMSRRRLVGFFQKSPAPLGDLSALLEEYCRLPEDARVVSDLYEAVQRFQDHEDADVQDFVGVVKKLLEEDAVAVHDGFVIRIETGSDGQERALIEGYDIRLPRRLFLDPLDFAENQFVRLVQRGGLALGLLRVPVPESQYVCGMLTQPLEIGERGIIYGVITDSQNKTYYFEMSHLIKGSHTALRVGDLMKMTRTPAPRRGETDFLAFNIQTEFSREDLPLLQESYEKASHPEMQEALLRKILGLLLEDGEDRALHALLQAKLAEMDEATRKRFVEPLSQREQEVVANLLESPGEPQN